jgi:hypothetical protein
MNAVSGVAVALLYHNTMLLYRNEKMLAGDKLFRAVLHLWEHLAFMGALLILN